MDSLSLFFFLFSLSLHSTAKLCVSSSSLSFIHFIDLIVVIEKKRELLFSISTVVEIMPQLSCFVTSSFTRGRRAVQCERANHTVNTRQFDFFFFTQSPSDSLNQSINLSMTQNPAITLKSPLKKKRLSRWQLFDDFLLCFSFNKFQLEK
jgi:hypothetical protein